VATSSAPWSLQQKLSALERGYHQSAKQHVDFLCSEFIDMIKKGQWILLPATQVLNNRNLQLKGCSACSKKLCGPSVIKAQELSFPAQYTKS
jgi:hypothetical protein